MGCTSSAPNMVTPKSNTAEKSIQFEGDISDRDSNDVEEIIYRAEDTAKDVLPSCDTLTERIHNIVRNKSTRSLPTIEKDHDNSNLILGNKMDTTVQHEEKIPKLEEVVEKVVELHNIEHFDETHDIVTKNEVDHINKENNGSESVKDDIDEKENVVNNGNESDGEQKAEHPAEGAEAISPSQSEISRATRWEALADIAAELPASLAVDPITGQIYALSK